MVLWAMGYIAINECGDLLKHVLVGYKSVVVMAVMVVTGGWQWRIHWKDMDQS